MSTNTVPSAPEPGPLDLAEKGRRGREEISLDRRLFMKFTAFGGCPDPSGAVNLVGHRNGDVPHGKDATTTGSQYL